MFYKTKNIVLQTFPYSDSSLIVKSVSKDFGLLSFLIKGLKSKKNDFKIISTPFTLSEIVFTKTPKSSFCFLKDGTLLDYHFSLRNNLTLLAEANVMAEVLLKFATEGIALNQEFELLKSFLEKMDASKNQESYLSSFLYRLCSVFGFHYNVETCGICGMQLLTPPADFKEDSGVVFCESCAKKIAIGKRFEFLSDLFYIQKNKMPKNPNLLETGLLHYLQKHSGIQKELKSFQYLQDVRKLCSV